MKALSIPQRSYLRNINQAIQMKEVFYAPMTKEEALRRIEEAERDIAEVPHEEVMRRAWELLKKYGC